MLSSRNLGQEPTNGNGKSLNKVKKLLGQVKSDIGKNGKILILGWVNKASAGKFVFYPRKCIFKACGGSFIQEMGWSKTKVLMYLRDRCFLGNIFFFSQ